MKTLIWLLQIALGLFFVLYGVAHFVVPAGLPDQMSWMYDLPVWAHVLVGLAELVGGLGLILPSVTRVLPGLTPLAALGLALVMLGAAIFHIIRSEYPNLVINIVVAALLIFVAYARTRTQVIQPR